MGLFSFETKGKFCLPLTSLFSSSEDCCAEFFVTESAFRRPGLTDDTTQTSVSNWPIREVSTTTSDVHVVWLSPRVGSRAVEYVQPHFLAENVEATKPW